MGGEVKTSTTDNFKALELEMELRQKGMEKMSESMNAYVKAVSKRSEVEKKEKTLPIAYMGASMITHGEDFEHDSEYGQCLSTFGKTQERLARSQESYITAATTSWADSLERSLVQMKELQAARRKLESRRLAYDTSLAKMQKAKREDFRVEEELRSQQMKYGEAEADVERRMFEIKDAEGESVNDLTAFLEAQLSYHDSCREALLQLQNEWPAQAAFGQAPVAQRQVSSQSQLNARPSLPNRSRSNTVRSFLSTQSDREEAEQVRPSIRSRQPSSRYGDVPAAELEVPRARPGVHRATTYQTQPQERRDISPVQPGRLSRVPSESVVLQSTRTNLRRVDTMSSQQEQDVFADESPLTPQGSGSQTPVGGRRPPPPPPSRSSKPGGLGKAAPPPPPAKRTLIA